ncbi:MAG: TIGR00730 family Rossman fold protein [Rhizomicrobium sp.]|jgi:uncharacterized protein (TIGR00730 family)
MNDKTKPAICVFCGSSYGANPQYAVAARTLGRLIAERGFSLVFGGGGPGLMGETARAARDGGAHVSGFLPQFLRWVELPPEWEKDLIITPDLQERKTRMLAMADAFVVLPGGAGTMDEFFEVVTSASLGVLNKPILVVNTEGYFDALEQLMNHIVREGFARPKILDLYRFVDTPEEAIDAIADALGLLPRG